MAIPVISKLKPANNGDFPVVDAHDVDMGDNKRLDQVTDYLEQALDDYADIVDGHTADIAVISKDVSDCKTQVDKNVNSINSLSDKEATDRAQISRNTSNIQNLENTTIADGKKIDQNTKDIGELTKKIEECESKVSGNSENITNITKEVSDSKELINKNKADIEELTDTLNANIPDDTIVGSQPWTSKHIVDMLCPPLEVSGNPVQCYPVVGYPLGIKASWEPVQEGEGDPSPDNIRPIKGRDSVIVTRCGENLIVFPYTFEKQSKNGLTIEAQQDGRLIVNGTATASTYFAFNVDIQKKLPLNTVMSLSGCPAGGDVRTGYYIGLYLGGKWYPDFGTGCTVVIFNTRDIASRVEITINGGVVCDNLTFWPKLEIGDKITPYCKYQGNTVTLSLPETIYGGSVDVASGEGQTTWTIITLTGTEPWSIATTGDYYVWLAYSNIQTTADINIGLCSHYKYQTNKNFEQSLNVQPNGAVVAWHVNDTFETVEDWKSYLAAQYAADTPVQVAYKLAEPVSYEASGAETTPALESINTILSDADSVTVTGRKDPVRLLAGLDA